MAMAEPRMTTGPGRGGGQHGSGQDTGSAGAVARGSAETALRRCMEHSGERIYAYRGLIATWTAELARCRETKFR